MQAGAPYVPPDCQTYPGGQKRVLIKNRPKKNPLRVFFEQNHSLPLYLS